jgi:hypothetical protein
MNIANIEIKRHLITMLYLIMGETTQEDMKQDEQIFITVTINYLIKHFNVSAEEINEYFSDLESIYKYHVEFTVKDEAKLIN